MTKGWFYKALVFGSHRVGPWFFKVFAWFVSTGYFVFFPRRVKTGLHFYKALFPNRHLFYHIWCTWKQFHDFADVFLERAMIVNPRGTASFSSRGLEHLERAVKNRTGGVILMSHAGSWDAAAHHLKRELPGISLLLYMGTKHKEQIEGLQKDDLIKTGIRVIAIDRDCGSPFDIVEGVKQLKGGGMVSMTGDMLWHRDQRRVCVSFLGYEAALPETPYLLALLFPRPPVCFFLPGAPAGGAIMFQSVSPLQLKALHGPIDTKPSGMPPRNMPTTWRGNSAGIPSNGTILSRSWGKKLFNIKPINCHSFHIDISRSIQYH